MSEQRAAFEKWISSPPFELEVFRWPNEPEKVSWPGAYKDYRVSIAWEAWQAALDAANKRIAELTEGAEVVGGDMAKRLQPDRRVGCNSTRWWIVSKEYNTRHAAEKALKGTP